jgi:hypothetical protein
MKLSHSFFIFTFFILTLGAPSFAQSGHIGNGGSGGEPTFTHLKDLLVQWIELGALNIDVRKSPKPLNWKNITAAMQSVPVQFDPSTKPLTVGNSRDRACKNYPNLDPKQRYIECNLILWNEIAPSDQLAVVFHEYLGVLEYESNDGEISQYPLSSQLLGIMDGDQDSINQQLEKNGLDSDSIQTAPNAILTFVQTISVKEKSNLVVNPNGTFDLQISDSFYSHHEFKGGYLKNGDYVINADGVDKLKGTIGSETIEIRQPHCESWRMILIWNASIGIKSIQATTGCAFGNFNHGYTTEKTEAHADGSVSINHGITNLKPNPHPIHIRINSTEYENNYVSPIFKE